MDLSLQQSLVSHRPAKAQFDLDRTLSMHAWHPSMTHVGAETALEGKPTYTYLLRKSISGRKFEISFVQPNGTVKHDEFSLIDPIYGIWRNGMPSHVGTLAKVIRDMMDCDMDKGQPL